MDNLLQELKEEIPGSNKEQFTLIILLGYSQRSIENYKEETEDYFEELKLSIKIWFSILKSSKSNPISWILLKLLYLISYFYRK